MTGPLRTAFIGIGWWGTMLADAAGRTGGAIEVALGCGLDEAEATAFARRFGCAIAKDYASVLADESIAAIVLATPHLMHVSQIVAAARAGKHIFVEKPLATTLADALLAVDVARSNRVALAVGHNRRLLAQVEWLKNIVVSGHLGRLLHVDANFSTAEALAFSGDHWRASREQCPGGAMTVLGVHVIDWLHHLFGPVGEVSAVYAHRGTPADIDDVALARMSFSNGLSAHLVCLYSAPYTNRFVVYGTEAIASVLATGPESEVDRPLLTIAHRSGDVECISVPFVDTLSLQLQRFADAIRGRSELAVSGEEAGANIAVLDALTLSARAGGDRRAVDYGTFRVNFTPE